MKKVYQVLGPEGFGAYEVNWTTGEWRRVVAAPKSTLVPGFVDIHIHGAFGVDFMSATDQEMLQLCSQLSAEGYEAFLPTTVTASLESVQTALKNLPEHPMIPGFHLEGPFISPEYPGAQPTSAIVDPPVGKSAWDAVLSDQRLKVITLAPERPHALALISRLMKRGVVVSMGHTSATHEQARRGFEFGAAHTTHTFNAMRGLHHREAGIVGYALTNDAVSTELIYDRNHVCKEAAELLFQCKPADKVIAVSDSTKATGLPPRQKLEMWGHKVVTAKNEVRLEKSGALAGSAITLLQAFKNLHEDFGPEVAIRACSLNPRAAIGLGEPKVYYQFDQNLEIVDRIVVKG